MEPQELQDERKVAQPDAEESDHQAYIGEEVEDPFPETWPEDDD